MGGRTAAAINLYDGYFAKDIGRKLYQVTAPDGTVVGIAGGDVHAITIAERHRRKALERRIPCLCCTTIFTSTGPGHRLCADCRAQPGGLI